MKKILLLLGIVLLMTSFVIADFSINATNYYDNSTIMNFSAIIVPYSQDWCYQENANVSTDCGGLNSGSYSHSYSGSSGWTTINYTKPPGSISIKWEVKHGNLRYNISLPSSCLNANPTDILLRMYSVNSACVDNFSSSYVACLNNSGGWETIGNIETGGCEAAGVVDSYTTIYDGNWNSGVGFWWSGSEILSWQNSGIKSKVYEEAMWWMFNPEGGNYSTTNGSIVLNAHNPSNITIFSNQSGGYFNRTYLNYNTSNNLTAQLWQAELLVNPKEAVSGNNITGGNFTVGSQIVNNGNPLKLKAGSYNVTFQHPNYLTTITNFSISALQNLSVNMSIPSAQLNITATNLVSGLGIQNFTVDISTTNFSTSLSTTNYTLYAGLDINRTYNLTIHAQGFELKNVTVYLQNITQKYNFTLYTANSVVIHIFNEATGSPLYENVSIKFTGSSSENTYYTNTSTYYKDSLTPGEYQLLFSATGYSPRTYTITVGNLTSQSLNAYLAANTSTTLFTITDFDTSAVLANVLSTMYKFINGSWQSIESKYSDITGKMQFTYIPSTNYKFYLSKTGYQDNIFYLNPILFSTYDVKLHSTSSLSLPQEELTGVSVIYSPKIFYNNNVSTFNFIISSSSGLLQSYGYTITYPGGSDTQSGSNAIGGQLSSTVNITNATVLDVVTLTYQYLVSSGANASYTVTFPIIVSNPENTFLSTMGSHYGLTLFERMLISTVIIIGVVGIAALVGNPLMGFLLGLVVFLYITIVGFIPLYLILPSLVIGVIFLFWRSGG